MKAFRFLTVVVLGLALAVAGTQVSAQDSDENVFVAAMHSDLQGNFCSLASATGANNTVWNDYVWAGIHPSLYTISVATSSAVPDLAAEPPSPFEEEDELFTSTVELLEGVQWSDGSEVTAEDVAFTFNQFAREMPSGNTLSIDLGGGWADAAFDIVDRVEAVDSHTVKFYLTERPGLADWQHSLLQWDIFNKEFWQPKFEEAYASDDPVGTLSAVTCPDEPSAGPFANYRWEQGAFAETDANSNYSFQGTVTTEYAGGGYEQDLPENLGGGTRSFGNTETDQLAQYEDGPFVDGVVYNILQTQQAGALAVINGEADYHFNPLGYGLSTLDQLEEAEEARVVTNQDNGFFYLSFNLRKSPFNYASFRRAVRCVIDKEFVAQNLLQGQVQAAYRPVPPALGGFREDLSQEERQAACVGMSEEDRLDRARQMLTDAGFSFEDGTLVADPEGNDIEQLELLHPNAAYDNNRNIFGLHINDRLNKLGVPVRDVPAGFNNIVTQVFAQQDFDMWQLGWSLTPYPDHLETFWHSRNTSAGGNAAQGGVCSQRENEASGCQEQFDQMADELLAATETSEAQEIAKQLQDVIFNRAAYVMTHYTLAYDAWRPNSVSWQGLEEESILQGIHGFTGLRSFVQK